MKSRVCLALIVAVLSVVAPVRAGFYDNFPVGSSVTLKEVSKAGGKTVTQRLRHVVIDAAPTIASYVEENGAFPAEPVEKHAPEAPSLPTARRMKVTDVREETLTIDGKTYPCKVTTFASPLEEVSYWVCRSVDVPYHEFPAEGRDLAVPQHTLKVQYVTRFGTEKVTNVLQVITFESPLKIDGRTIPCIQQKMTGSGTMHDVPISVSGYQWLSNDVPGRVVKHTLTVTRGATTIDHRREVESFSVPTE